MTNTVDAEAIIQARIRGWPVRTIARQLGCSIADVMDALDRHAAMTLTSKLRTHTLALELDRLDEMQRTFDKQAREGDVASAALVLKIIERRQIMLGLAAPPRVDPQLIELQIKPAETSTERIRAAIDRLLPKPEPEPEPDKPN